ncbi:hypothetical protein M0802_005391 [Mischocyttarus mexicanus]|nr:hypothetical protein M0802_005391 [Mischocyttarus mexicanus]
MDLIRAIRSVIMVTMNYCVVFGWDRCKEISNLQIVKPYKSITNLVILITLTSITFTSKFIWQRYKKLSNLNKQSNILERQSSELNSSSNSECIMEILFFTEDSVLCRMHINSNKCEKLDCPVANLNKLIVYLNSAKRTIHVCMYLFTCEILAKTIIAAKKRGVVIKVIADGCMNVLEHSQILSFRRACIKVRTKTLDNLMHHKFVIIDNNILITGSANWTMQAFFGNAENIIISNHSVLVKRFVNEFGNLWKVYDNDITGTTSLQLESPRG